MNSNNSFNKYANSNNYAVYLITYAASADISSADIYVTDIGFARNGVTDTSSPEYLYLSQNGVFEYSFTLHKNTAPEDVDVSIPPNNWIQGVGVEHAVTFASNPFVAEDTGTIAFYVRIADAYSDELIPPSCEGMEVYFAINF